MEKSEIEGLPEMWAVLELFGHQRAAGKLSTQNLGAACLLRLDVPEVTRKHREYNYMSGGQYQTTEVTTPAHTRFFGVPAIYSINPCSEETARAELQRIGNPPIVQMELERVKLLKAPPESAIDSPAVPADESERLNFENFCDKVSADVLPGRSELSTGVVCPNCHYGDCPIGIGVIVCPECGVTTSLEPEKADSAGKAG